MAVKSDRWIRRMARERGLIEPFVEAQKREGVISFGLSSYGYDMRVGTRFKVSRPGGSGVMDPKQPAAGVFEDVHTDTFLEIPPHAIALGQSVEYFRIPRNVVTAAFGKSTYARCGLVVNITPFEPEWEGFVTLEMSNTTPFPLRVYANEGIAQILFFESDEVCEVSYADRKGKYQGQTAITLGENMTPIEIIEKHPGALADIADLEDKGHRIVDVLGGDVVPTDATRDFVSALRDERRESFYSEVLHYLTSERYPEAQAQVLWKEILDHKFLMSERLGRNVGIRVSAFDYLLNVRKLLIAPRIINSHDFRRTVRLSRTDALTGLYNRRYFLEHTAKVLEAAEHVKAPVSLLMADLDNFKPFNDDHGHQAGDLLIQEIARLIRGCVRASDMVTRYGGDEFALLLPKATKAEAEGVAEKICRQIEENCQSVGVTISLGLAQFPVDATSREDLIAAADELLYRAKEFGGNQVSLYRPIRFHYTDKDGQVTQVSVVGDFNNWSGRSHGLVRQSSGKDWETTLPLKAGRYRYKFLLNQAHWIADPAATVFESDGFGGRCSVLIVK